METKISKFLDASETPACILGLPDPGEYEFIAWDRVTRERVLAA
jgi:hypothetical protein